MGMRWAILAVVLAGCGVDETQEYASCEDAAQSVGAAWDDCVGHSEGPLCTGHPVGGCAAATRLCDVCWVPPQDGSWFACEDGSDWADTQAVVCAGAGTACGGCP